MAFPTILVIYGSTLAWRLYTRGGYILYRKVNSFIIFSRTLSLGTWPSVKTSLASRPAFLCEIYESHPRNCDNTVGTDTVLYKFILKYLHVFAEISLQSDWQGRDSHHYAGTWNETPFPEHHSQLLLIPCELSVSHKMPRICFVT